MFRIKVFLLSLSVIIPSLASAFVQSGSDGVLHLPEAYLSGTLPVLYVNTVNGDSILSKEDYINATYYLDPNGIDGVEAFGSEEKPLPLEIRGRGNVTWTFPKKPYKIKLDKKAALLGMNASKHFALMSHPEQRWFSMIHELGYEVSRRMEMPWTPRQVPVELVLNGNYEGLYFVTETIRVEKTRVNIPEQKDGETDPTKVSGGWLAEIDNYTDDDQVVIIDGEGQWMPVTSHSPEGLSDVQRDYLLRLVTRVDSLIYQCGDDSEEWETAIDIDQLAKFYVINEVLDDVEAFTGSCYFSKMPGDDAKLMFGPVWDFGNAYRNDRKELSFIYDYYNDVVDYRHHWIKRIAQFPHFQERVARQWDFFLNNCYDGLSDYIINYSRSLKAASKSDYRRWRQKGDKEGLSITWYNSFITTRLKEKVEWLDKAWRPDAGNGDFNFDHEVNVSDLNILVSDILSGINPMTHDMNGDRKINVSDINILVSKVLNLE